MKLPQITLEQKRRILLVLVVTLFLLLVYNLFHEEVVTIDDKAISNSTSFSKIEGNDSLVYDSDTLIVYYLINTFQKRNGYSWTSTYFTPYISENGKFCKYENNEIVELN